MVCDGKGLKSRIQTCRALENASFDQSRSLDFPLVPERNNRNHFNLNFKDSTMKYPLSIPSPMIRSELRSAVFTFQPFPFNGNTNHSTTPFSSSCLDLTYKCHKTTGMNILLVFLSQPGEGNLELECKAEKKDSLIFEAILR